MPGLRYGPDIADDAAYMIEKITALLDKADKAKARGRELSAEDKQALAQQTKAFKDFFNVGAKDVRKRNFGDAGILAEYAFGKKRSKFAKGEKPKPIRKEHEDRGAIDPPRTRYRKDKKGNPEDEAMLEKTGAASYQARTAPARFREARARAFGHMAKRGPLGYKQTGSPKIKVKVNNEADLDYINIARSKKMGRVQGGKPLRPPLASTMARKGRADARRGRGAGGGTEPPRAPTAANKKRARQVANATKRLTKGPKKAKGAKKATRPAASKRKNAPRRKR